MFNNFNVDLMTNSSPNVEEFDEEFYNFCRDQDIISRNNSDRLKTEGTEVDPITLSEILKGDRHEWENDLRQIHVKR